MADRAWRIRVHEAGHAVGARLLGLPRCGAAIIVEPYAKAVFDCGCGERSVIALMAGTAAETIVFGVCDPIGFSNDWRRVTGALKRAGDDGGVAMLWAQTMGLLRPHGGLIRRVADHRQSASRCGRVWASRRRAGAVAWPAGGLKCRLLVLA